MGGGAAGGKGGGGRPDSYGAPPHDYTRVEGDDAAIDIGRVDDLLSARVGAKRAGDFRMADRIRNELRSLGVAVLDRERQWHVIVNDGAGGRPDTDGQPYGGYGGAHNMGGRFGDKGHDYRRDDGGEVEVDEAKVDELLSARLHARLNRDFVAADDMRAQLRRDFGVEVFDQERVWRAVAPEGYPALESADGAAHEEGGDARRREHNAADEGEDE